MQRNTGYFPTESLEPSGNRLFSRSALNEGDLFRGSLVLKEAVNDQYDYIDWWLYDASPDYKVWTEDGTKEWCLKEPGALYDFIVAGT